MHAHRGVHRQTDRQTDRGWSEYTHTHAYSVLWKPTHTHTVMKDLHSSWRWISTRTCGLRLISKDRARACGRPNGSGHLLGGTGEEAKKCMPYALVCIALTLEINEWISLFFPMCCWDSFLWCPSITEHRLFFWERFARAWETAGQLSSQERLKAVEITFSDTDRIQSESNQCQMLKHIGHIQFIQQWDCILKYTGRLCHVRQKKTHSALTKGLQRKGKKVWNSHRMDFYII